jgi:hypothetical protein
MKWSGEGAPMQPEERRRLSRSFLTKGLEKRKPSFPEFAAYGQACHEMALGILQLLQQLDAKLFACMIPKEAMPPKDFDLETFLRKDHVFLLERFYYFLEEHKECGLLVMDEVEKESDRKFVRQMQRYFTKTSQGRLRSSRVVPAPFFVSSEMTHPVQAADLCIYALNWGFRLPAIGLNSELREDVAEEFGPWLHRLQYSATIERDGQQYQSYGIVFVPDPYQSRA